MIVNLHLCPFAFVRNRRLLPLLAVLLASLTLFACSTPSSTPTPAPVITGTTPLPPPAIEVTRVVTHEVVVTATPAPPPAPAACAPARLASDKEIVVGVLAPFSQNPAWPKAIAVQASTGLAVEDINKAGGIRGARLRLVMQDTTGDPATAARLAQELITRDCATAIVGGILNDEAAAVKQVTEQFGTPFLIVDAGADELTADKPKSVFRLAPTASMMNQMPAQWLKAVGDFNGDSARSVYLIAENTPAVSQAVDQVAKVLDDLGIQHEILRVDTPTQDYSPQIARIVASDATPDAILIYVTGEAALDVQRQLLDAGITPQKGTLIVTGRSALDKNLFWQRIPDGAYTVIARRGPWNTSIGDMGKDFVARYQAYSPHWPDSVGFAAYDAVHLIADAATRAPSLQPTDMVAALEATQAKLASGFYEFPFNAQQPPSGGADEPAYLWHQWPHPPLLYLQYSTAQQDPLTLDVVWPPTYRTIDAAVLKP